MVVVDPCSVPPPLLALHFLSQVQLFCQVHLPLPGIYLPEVFPLLLRSKYEVKNQSHSLVILVILLPRPRNPSNGELAAKILRMASYPVSELPPNCKAGKSSHSLFLSEDIPHLHNRRWREIARWKCCCVASQPPGSQIHPFILGELHLLHISVFVGLDVSDGNLADYEDRLSGGEAFPSVHRSMVEHILILLLFCFWLIILDSMYFLGNVVCVCGVNLLESKREC